MNHAFRTAILTSVFALAGLTAHAADLTYEPAPVVEAPAIYNWTGLYIGANIGYGWGDIDTT